MSLLITHAGIAAAIRAGDLGIEYKITHISIGSAGYVPNPDQTALVAEIQRKAITRGALVAQGQLHFETVWDGDEEFEGKELGYWLEDGTLFAVDSRDGEVITYKHKNTVVTEACELNLAASTIENITVEFLGSPYATEQVSGTAKIATSALVIAGIDDTTIVTPKKLEEALSDKQFAKYDATRAYSIGEVCYTKDTETGQVSYWEWYSNVESLADKDPLDTLNRQTGWIDETKPFYWIPYKKSRPGTPLWPWMSMIIPEGTLNVVGNSVPAAVFWRLAKALPELVNMNTGMIDFPETGGEFFRVLDQGRGLDTGRNIGSSQNQSIQHHGVSLLGKGVNDAVATGNIVHLGRRGTGSDPVGILGYSGTAPEPNQYYNNYANIPYGFYSDGEDETRPSNLAFLMLIEV
ncbi:phage tail protein [Vibrio fluvialis]